MQRRIDLRHGGDIRQHGIVRQVAERLEHDAHHRDLFPLRDVRRFVLRKRRARLLLAVALRRVWEHFLHAVNKGIHRSLGNVDLHVRPRVDKAVIGGPVCVNVRIGVNGEVRAERQRKAGQRAEKARERLERLLAHQKNGKQQHGKRKRNARQHGLCQLKRVMPHNAARRAQDAQVGGKHRVAAQLDLIVAAKGKRKAGDGGGEIRRPRAAEQEKAQKHQQHRDKEIQRHEQRQPEIGQKQIQVVQRRVGIGGEHHADQPDANAHERQPAVKPRAVRAAQPLGRLGVWADERKQSVHTRGTPFRW